MILGGYRTIMFYQMCKNYVRKWFDAEDGLAAIEGAFVFPLLAVLLLGTYDMGNAILASQKSIRASQVTADLITRDAEVNNAMINEAVWAGEIALQPLDTTSYGVDIVSIRFDDTAQPQIEWRETRNMLPNMNVLTSVAALAEAGNGVVVVTIEYEYEPLFVGFSMGSFSIGNVPMQEMAFARGRNSPVVDRI